MVLYNIFSIITTYLALNNEFEKCGGVGFESGGASVIIGYKKVASNLKKR